MLSTKALMLLPSSAMVTVALLPSRSTTELSSTPQVEAMSVAYAARKSERASADTPANARLTISTVTRTLESRRHPVPTQGVQSPLRIAPFVCVHLPSGQMLQAVASKSPLQVPAGQDEQAEAPGTVLYVPGAHLRHTVSFA